MTGLRPPPKAETTSRVFLRFVVLVLLLIAAGVVIWTTVTLDRIELIEDVSLEDLENNTVVTPNGTVINVVRQGEGTVPLVMLHDVDVAGGVTWDGVVSELDPRFSVIRVDLPGFGLSERIPDDGSQHTVASMAEEVSDVIQQSFDQAAVVVGVGLGGEVAAEIAVTQPDLIAGLLMLDVDFFKPRAWDEFVERLPWVGTAATYALETSGPLAAGRWAPNCESGGWCPTPSQVEARDLAETIADTSESINSFRRTPAASQVPSKLGQIATPTTYLWSQSGEVPRESVDRVQEAMPAATVEVVAEAWKAHLDTPGVVASTIAAFLQ